MIAHNQYQKIVPFVLFVLALILLFLLVRPMITILLSSVLIAYVAFPIYKKIDKKIAKKSLSVILSLVIIVIIVLIPLSFLAFEITQQGYSFSQSLSNVTEKGALFGFGCNSANSEVCLLLNQAEKFSLQKLSAFGLDDKLQGVLPAIEDKMINFIFKMPIIIAEIFLALIISYFILKDWKNILKKIEDILPMRTKTKKKLVEQFSDVTYTVIYAQLFVALVQGVIATIGFYIFGAPFALILGVLAAFCALIPSIGASIIWLPASVFLMLSGYYTNNYLILWDGIGLFFYCVLIVSTIDNILLATIVKAKTHVSQITVIVGVIGGAAMFGVMGIFIGPTLLPLLITYFETFKERFH